MAAITILRSMVFSRPAASAICNSSRRFALTPACAMAWPPPTTNVFSLGSISCRRGMRGSLLGAPQARADQRIGEHQARLGHPGDGQGDDVRRITLERD